jgi:hypothetical protein
MEIIIERAWKKADYTIGRLFVNGERICESLEDTDRGLKSSFTDAAIKAIKIAGKTAIPTGTYKVVLSVSPKFKNKSWAKKYGGLVPEIVGVKCYVGIRMHPGANAEQTEGCPLVGENKVKGGLINSQKTYCELMDKYFIPAWNRKEEITITIR